MRSVPADHRRGERRHRLRTTELREKATALMSDIVEQERRRMGPVESVPAPRRGVRLQEAIWTGVPSGSIFAILVITSLPTRTQPWLTEWPIDAGSFVP